MTTSCVFCVFFRSLFSLNPDDWSYIPPADHQWRILRIFAYFAYFFCVHNLFNPNMSYIPLILRNLFPLNPDYWSYIPQLTTRFAILTPDCPIYPLFFLFFVLCLLSNLMIGPIYPQLTTCFAELFYRYTSNPNLSYISPILNLMNGPI